MTDETLAGLCHQANQLLKKNGLLRGEMTASVGSSRLSFNASVNVRSPNESPYTRPVSKL